MKLKKINQKGVAPLEIVLLLVVVAIIGGIGWYVYQAKQKNNQVNNSAANAGDITKYAKKKSTPKPAPPPPDPMANWTAYSSQADQLSFKYPNTWVKSVCDSGIILLGGNQASVGACNSDSLGQVNISSVAGDVRANDELTQADYPDLVTEVSTVNGVTGKKQTGTFKANGQPALGPATGDKIVKYTFFTNNKTYVLSDNIKAPYPDVLSDFNMLVTMSFKFQP